MKRPPRPPRAPFKKTKYSIGYCKRPTCTCWTPAGCIGPGVIDAMGGDSTKTLYGDCIAGPCWDYGACVTHQCGSAAGCIVHGILRFWINQYKAVAVWVDPHVTAATNPAVKLGRQLLGALGAPGGFRPPAPAIPPGAYTQGCPPGMFWGVGMTGITCHVAGAPQRPATAEELASIGVIV